MKQASIRTKDISKDLLHRGKTGIFINLKFIPMKGGADEYGNDHWVFQDVSKEQREQGIKGPIIGRARLNRK